MTVQQPTPWTLSEIRPELLIFGPNNQKMTLGFDANPQKAIANLKDSGLLSYPRIVFIAHGFWNNSQTQWLHDMKNQMLEREDQTVVIVGWGKGAELPAFKYPQAAINVEPIGVWLGSYVLELKKRIGNKIKVWGIGHGLGAHLMGIAGRNTFVKNNSAFSRITGLDPAGPAFEKVNEHLMLRKTDCPFVDVVHTDSYHVYRSPDWLSLINHYGTLKPLGTLDIYVNYGYDQPNAANFTDAGSHMRAVELFLWSIENAGELRSQWILESPPDIDKPVTKLKRVVINAELGYHCWDNRAIGTYFLETNGEIPWK